MDPQYTDTGIEIGYRYESIFAIPEDVRPVVRASPLSDYPKGQPGKRGPGPRRGRDHKTYWCRCCDAAVATKAISWCDECEKDRAAAAVRQKRAAQAGQPTEITFPLDVLKRLVDLSDDLLSLIGNATVEFDREVMSGGAIDDLMLATKDLAGFLDREIRPTVRRAIAPPTVTVEEARRQRRPPAASRPGQHAPRNSRR